MAEPLTADSLPLDMGADGVLRVSGTRVTLDSIVGAFQAGVTAEEICEEYPSVPRADVYQVIGYFLHHTTEIESYLARRRRQKEQARRMSEAIWSPDGVRARLLDRRPK